MLFLIHRKYTTNNWQSVIYYQIFFKKIIRQTPVPIKGDKGLAFIVATPLGCGKL